MGYSNLFIHIVVHHTLHPALKNMTFHFNTCTCINVGHIILVIYMISSITIYGIFSLVLFLSVHCPTLVCVLKLWHAPTRGASRPLDQHVHSGVKFCYWSHTLIIFVRVTPIYLFTYTESPVHWPDAKFISNVRMAQSLRWVWHICWFGKY